MKKRARKKTSKPPPQRSARATSTPSGPLLYKVVELSTVDEHSLERCLNTWVQKGWNLDGVQFAMREASKRPAMAFVFFTREGAPEDEDLARSPEEANAHLHRLASEPGAPAARAVSAHERLMQLAGEFDSESSDGEGERDE